ncbi:helix-turn-helix transcriptional regulator [Cupriavidus sp. 30B13]|uniref:AraC family transcriptional regulator n=1 Tax=Cupriavidus sp. 30B13 TaxID=3384241 RepID=UPI003B917457
MQHAQSQQPSPHLRYYGGPFGRVSLLASDVEFADHARDCEQALVNVDAQPLYVRIDEGLHRLDAFEAILIRPRQTYAIPREGRPAPDGTPGSILIKASDALVDAAGLASARFRPGAKHNAVVPLGRRLRDEARQLLSELTAAQPGPGGLEEGIRSLFGPIAAAALDDAPGAVLAAPWMAADQVERALAEKANTLLFGEMNAFREVREIARSYEISERHFFTLFRRATGLPPRAFYNMRRLEMAFALLLDDSRTVTDVGYELGFSAPPHFTRFLRANTGWTPSAYRRVIGQAPAPLRPTLRDTVLFVQNETAGMRRLP